MTDILDPVKNMINATGWKLLDDFVNQNQKFGFFFPNGEPFYRFTNSNATKKQPTDLLDSVEAYIEDIPGKIWNDQKLTLNEQPEAGVTDLRVSNIEVLTTAPVEQGNFNSYNHVQTPSNGQVVYIVSGTDAQRDEFVKAIERAQRSEYLFWLVEQKRVIKNVKILGYNIGITTKSGVQLKTYVIPWREVREVTKSNKYTITNPRNPYDSSTVDQGHVELQKATPTQVAAAIKAISG